ncbi:hypothetical protein [Haliscomenobacter hydrossis]|uniref:Lipocalin-like domain-containing protein n=1 Tax=Haliscomenobacter hydrossis (strain ATCC 27775 / DSM 1100 / LMG 10767 / O) TaxID=760192 RepID=F4KY52_HALH1|nr:hypothetical protein [Haliscomenobacter hydrossis]AEE53677.1 hypothetical protein Halhy_5854 [Haliscomenobacter hydrossis DSM 1100]
MNKILQYLLLMSAISLMMACEGEDEEEPAGYVISTLIEVKGKQRIDRTSEASPCRLTDKWVFDLPNKAVTTDYYQGSCTAFTHKHAFLQNCDTMYLDSLKGRYLWIGGTTLYANIPPIVHPDFPMGSQRGDSSINLFYRIEKFDHKELVILNKFNPKLIPRDSQYFELTMKYVEQ